MNISASELREIAEKAYENCLQWCPLFLGLHTFTISNIATLLLI